MRQQLERRVPSEQKTVTKRRPDLRAQQQLDILFEPYGLYGRWLKVKLFFQLFPLYKRATFKRQKTYVKSERNR